AELAGLRIERFGEFGVLRDAVALRVGGGQLVARLAVAGLAGEVVVLGRLGRVLLHALAAGEHHGGVEAAERVPPLAAQLRELAALDEVLVDALSGEVEAAEQRARAGAVLGGVNVVLVLLAVAGLAEDLRGLGLVLRRADAVAVRAADVQAAAEVRGLARRAV